MQKYLLQTPMLVYPEGLEVLILVWAFIYIHTMCMRSAKAQVGLHLHVCAESPEPSLKPYAQTTI